MNLTDIAINNLKRRKSKMVFLVLSMVIGICTVVVLLSVSRAMKEEIGTRLDEFGANIVIVPKSDQLSLSYGGITVPGLSYDVKELDQTTVDRIKTIKLAENLGTIAPKVLGAVDVGGHKSLMIGVDFKQELRMKKWWEITGRKPQTPDETLLGHAIAAKLGIRSGDTFSAKGMKFKVAGIINETGAQEDNLIFADLGVVQNMLGNGGRLSMIEVAAYCNTCPIEEITREIARVLPDAKVTALKQAAAARLETVGTFNRFAFAISIVVLLIGGLVVMTTMMASVSERTREIGIFRAMGFRKLHVGRIILTEAVIVSSVAGIVGYLLGISSAKVLGPAIAQMKVAIPWDPFMAVAAVLLAIFIGILASIYPAYRASNLDPSEALRFI